MSACAAAWRRRLVVVTEGFLAAGGALASLRPPQSPRAHRPLHAPLRARPVRHPPGSQRQLRGPAWPVAVLVLAVILVPVATEIGIAEFSGVGALLHTAYQARPSPSTC